MFGSLVIVYPTEHTGGELVLRHKKREWTFDASALISSRPYRPLAYAAFYSDVEHEVLKVTDGSRISLTYNLYLVPHGPTFQVPTSPDSPTPSVKQHLGDSANFQATLRQLLKNPTFMPKGGTLAFNLAHLYPVTFDTKLKAMTAYLKGEDAHVYQSRLELGLKPLLQMIYVEASAWNGKRPGLSVMTGSIAEKGFYYPAEESSYETNLVEEYGGIPVNLSNDIRASPSDHWDGDMDPGKNNSLG